MTTVRPAPFRITVVESAVDHTEEERPSGLIIKQEERRQVNVKRGIVMEVGPQSEGWPDDWEVTKGDIVYYQLFLTIGDVHIVRMGDIVAWESGAA